MKHVKRFLLVTLVAFSLPVWAGGDSSDGHSHEAPAPLPVSQSVTPRAVAATEEFEVVTSLEGKKLVVYVDRFASNEPVAQAKVEIEGAGLKGVASETTPGTYVLDVATPLPPARHPLTISVEAGDSIDLLTTTLDTSGSVTTEVHTHGWREWVVWALPGALLLITGIWFAVRRHKRAKKGI
ncbi:hypothetical protein CAP2UW1_4706 (plasmid) [Candidatus Accumulibacter phosphatis clade IIA str. UW-1]|uniref:Uncharacterized protein n=1 Tax=Accumulibacter regalis TaxID=522306 RepID=C7RW21_ACCRE